jgi:hypothetical protein
MQLLLVTTSQQQLISTSGLVGVGWAPQVLLEEATRRRENTGFEIVIIPL